jgi:hypothetical protein
MPSLAALSVCSIFMDVNMESRISIALASLLSVPACASKLCKALKEHCSKSFGCTWREDFLVRTISVYLEDLESIEWQSSLLKPLVNYDRCAVWSVDKQSVSCVVAALRLTLTLVQLLLAIAFAYLSIASQAPASSSFGDLRFFLAGKFKSEAAATRELARVFDWQANTFTYSPLPRL